jgi:hypothetical protein
MKFNRRLAVTTSIVAALVLAVAVPTASSRRAGSNGINLLCLTWGSQESGGMHCVPDNERYQVDQATVETMSGSTSEWTLVRASIPGAPTLVCARHYARSVNKSTYSGVGGLSCFRQGESFPLSEGNFRIDGTLIPTHGGTWWVNKLQVPRQSERSCLTWESQGAGVFCLDAADGHWNGRTPALDGTRLDYDWWANTLTMPGMKPQVCITWDSHDSGGLSCFAERDGFDPHYTKLLLAKRLNSSWGVNVVRLTGGQRVCVTWDGVDSVGGGLSCVAYNGRVNPASARIREFPLGHGYMLARVHIGG